MSLLDFQPELDMAFFSLPSEEVNDGTSPETSKDMEHPVDEQMSRMMTLESNSPRYWKFEEAIYTSVCPFELFGDNQYSKANHNCQMWSICKDGDDCIPLDCTKKHVSPVCPDALLNGVFDLKSQSRHFFNRFMHPKTPKLQHDQEVLMIQKLRHIYINRMKHLQLPRGACMTLILLPPEDSRSQIMQQVRSAKPSSTYSCA
ncbi:hypothetical protein sscle_11g086530 [Sclerotinia sclerotiorum 1980 UF-70]|uniref:Uncharacterized protein n=1 Tax=Sclerotinia sclerotiorum (strain ATCC 18683 / 1980 / Ss-1) TaxID=665079 RepID=A0A1D9QGY0_SCLS1|nr:hypothetical protein sscle_11g086530 [Sclerotinia sclerotiorum 1980 UF-70]